MTAFELRRHLAADHQIPSRGLNYEQLIAIHEDDHQVAQGHDHNALR